MSGTPYFQVPFLFKEEYFFEINFQQEKVQSKRWRREKQSQNLKTVQ